MPASATDRSTRASTLLLLAVTVLWVTVIGFQAVVWTLTCVMSGRFGDPGWLWTLLVGGAVVLVVRVVITARRGGAR